MTLKILFSCGNAPGLPTGYGGQGLLALQAFQRVGAEVTVLAWNLNPHTFTPFETYETEEVIRKFQAMERINDTRAAASVNWAAVKWMCNPYTQFPTTIRKKDLNRMISSVNADLFVSLQDIFMFEPGAFACLSAVWMPLHFLPVEHPTVLSLADFDIQLPISGWGSLLLQPLMNANPQALRHISVLAHGRDVEVYNSTEKHNLQQRERVRSKWGWPEDAFVCLLIASNSEESGRKAFDAQIQAFAEFKRQCDASAPHIKPFLHIHAEVVRAYDIARLLETFGLFETRAHWIDPTDPRSRTWREAVIKSDCCAITAANDLMSVSEAELVAMYQSADVLLAATCSEGCGVPILEAQLCGTPVITTRSTAMFEETHYGISVKPAQWIARMDFNSGWAVPDAKAIAASLMSLASGSLHLETSAISTVKQEFSNESIIAAWEHVLALVESETSSAFSALKLRLRGTRRTFLRTATAVRKRRHEMNMLSDSIRVETKHLMKQWLSRLVRDEVQALSS